MVEGTWPPTSSWMQPSIGTSPAGYSPIHLVFVYKDMMVSHGHERGTRPGSPLADIIFHVLMADCLIELNAWIQSDPSYSSILADLGISF